MILLVAAPVACGGERSFTSKQLATIMPSAGDAPASTSIRAELSGPKTLDEFIDAPEVRTKLKSLGFKVAYVATFATPNLPVDPLKAPNGAALYATFGVLLRDANAAHEGFAFYETRSRSRATNPIPVLVAGFGEDSVAFRFARLEETAFPGIAYLWRVGNALFSVVGVGVPGPDPAATRALAMKINVRVKR